MLIRRVVSLMLDEGWFELGEFERKGWSDKRKERTSSLCMFIITCAAIKRDDILELFVHVQQYWQAFWSLCEGDGRIMADVCENKMSSILFYWFSIPQLTVVFYCFMVDFFRFLLFFRLLIFGKGSFVEEYFTY